MTTLREAAQLALEYISWQAFGECRIGEGPIPEAKDVVSALQQALAEPEQSARVPLTIEKIEACMKRAYAAAAGSRNLDICFAREIESEHGITTQPASVPFLPGEYETLTERGAVAWAGYDPKDDNK